MTRTVIYLTDVITPEDCVNIHRIISAGLIVLVLTPERLN